MTEARDAIQSAIKSTLENKHEPGAPTVEAFLGNLQETAKNIGFPLENQAGENFAFAILKREAPIDQRREAMNNAITSVRNTMLTQVLPEIGVDGITIAEKARAVSDHFAISLAENAAIYPKKPEKKDLAEEMLKMLSPKQPSPEDRIVSACVGFEIFQPYLVDRLLELAIYDTDKLREQIQLVQRDVSLINNFYRSTTHAAELAVEGTSSIPMEELIERMFRIGPIFAKLAQGLNLSEVLAAKIPDKEKVDFVSQIATGMQEGILPPDNLEQQNIASDLPEGLTYKGIISSASIAHVVETQTPSGQRRATKIKRPNIDQAITDNEDTFNLVTKAYSRFIEEHIKGTPLGRHRKQQQEVLPFILGTFVKDLRRELIFPDEVAAQKKGAEAFRHAQGIHVPKIDEEFTDDEHITMEYVEGMRLENLPAHIDHLKNLFEIPLRSFKTKILHGDMHGGNVKGRGDGSLVLYDWGKSVTLSPYFTKNMGKFLYAVARKNPDAIAKAYLKIQSPDHNQVTFEEARTIAHDVLESVSDLTDPQATRWEKSKKAFSRTAKGLTMAMGIRHQSIMDSDYVTALQTAVRYGSVVAKELEKPAYQDKKIRRRALKQSITAAIKEVYFTKSADSKKDKELPQTS